MRKNIITARYAWGFAAFMFALAFASAPLYDLFCRTTGFGGAPITATKPPERTANRVIDVQFDATVANGLTVNFTPEMREIPTQLGKVITVNYTVENKSNKQVTVVASYNVSPPQAGKYFNKLQCFCFTDQTLEAGEKRELPVVYFIDPDLETDKEFRNLRELSLHYTFFPSKKTLETSSAIR